MINLKPIIAIFLVVVMSVACGGGSSSSSEPSLAELDREVRVLPLGDSITQGERGRATYRYWLWKNLESEGFKVDFVGGQRGAFMGENSPSDFDRDHEGHWSWEASDIRFNAPAYAAAHQPDIVLLYVGTNDIIRGRGIDATVNEVVTVIDSFRQVNPNVIVLLAKVMPAGENPSELKAYGDSLESLVGPLGTEQSPIVMVDQFSGFSVSRDTYDGIHPSPSGEQKLATKWLEALRPYL